MDTLTQTQRYNNRMDKVFNNAINTQKCEALRVLMEAQTKERYIKEYGIDKFPVHERSCIVSIKPGNKYTKIDRGGSGVYMVDQDGQIWGIKAYGVIHRGYFYGTLDTINDYNWGDYTARKIK